ncbi:RRP8 protein, partial [Nyctiprogne leucopyga]|nr:RRP8 protein [Nyctiprogne leucopyga]
QRGRDQPQAGAGEEPGPGAAGLTGPDLDAAPAPAGAGRSAALRARMEERLLSARFRFINQQLYTCSSRDAARLFQTDPGAFEIYHRGFARQVGRWPENPVHRIVRYLRRRPASLVVADFGCGDCTIARSVKNEVHSFDLVPLSPRVTVCDMAEHRCHSGLGCSFHRGTLMVAEVASRFEDLRAFLNAMAQLGFKSVSKDLSSPFFYLLEFTKAGPPRPRPVPGLRLLPCLYKRR